MTASRGWWLPTSSKFREILERHNARCDEDDKLPLVKFHALRHSCASLLIEKGVDILTVSKRLGHSKITTTLDIYTHNLKKDDREAADVMGSIIDQNPDEKEDDEDDDQEPGLVMDSF